MHTEHPQCSRSRAWAEAVIPVLSPVLPLSHCVAPAPPPAPPLPLPTTISLTVQSEGYIKFVVFKLYLEIFT